MLLKEKAGFSASPPPVLPILLQMEGLNHAGISFNYWQLVLLHSNRPTFSSVNLHDNPVRSPFYRSRNWHLDTEKPAQGHTTAMWRSWNFSWGLSSKPTRVSSPTIPPGPPLPQQCTIAVLSHHVPLMTLMFLVVWMALRVFCELLLPKEKWTHSDLTQQSSTEGFLLPPWEECSIVAS